MAMEKRRSDSNRMTSEEIARTIASLECWTIARNLLRRRIRLSNLSMVFWRESITAPIGSINHGNPGWLSLATFPQSPS
jgi:hypothetical protein